MFLVPRRVYFSIRNNITDPERLNQLDKLNKNNNYIENAIRYNKQKSFLSTGNFNYQTPVNNIRRRRSMESDDNNNLNGDYQSPPPPPPPPPPHPSPPLHNIPLPQNKKYVSYYNYTGCYPLQVNDQVVEDMDQSPPPPIIDRENLHFSSDTYPQYEIEQLQTTPSTPSTSVTSIIDQENYEQMKIAVNKALNTSVIDSSTKDKKLKCPFCENKLFHSAKIFAKHLVKLHNFKISEEELKLGEKTIKKTINRNKGYNKGDDINKNRGRTRFVSENLSKQKEIEPHQIENIADYNDEQIKKEAKIKIYNALVKPNNSRLACPFCQNMTYATVNYFGKHLLSLHNYKLNEYESQLGHETLQRINIKTSKPKPKKKEMKGANRSNNEAQALQEVEVINEIDNKKRKNHLPPSLLGKRRRSEDEDETNEIIANKKSKNHLPPCVLGKRRLEDEINEINNKKRKIDNKIAINPLSRHNDKKLTMLKPKIVLTKVDKLYKNSLYKSYPKLRK